MTAACWGHLTPIAPDDCGLMVRLATPEKGFDPDHRGAIAGLTYTFGLEMHRLVPLLPLQGRRAPPRPRSRSPSVRWSA